MFNYNKCALSLMLGLAGAVGALGVNAASLAISPSSATVGLSGGATTPAGLSVVFTGDAAPGPTTVIGYQTDITFDNTQMSVALANGNADSCVLFSPNTIRIQDVDPALSLLPTGTACTLTFTVNNPQTAGTAYALTFAPGATLCSDSGAGSQTCGTTDGVINVVAGPQPALSSVPTPTSTITINDIVGGGATPSTLTISNTGQAGSTLTIQAPTGLSGELSITPNTIQTDADGGGGVAYTISCASAAIGTNSQVLSFAHDGTSPASPVTYNVDCIGVAGPTAPTASLGAVVQPPVGPINVAANGSVPVNIDTAGVATASLALTCTIPATGASNFQITGGGSRTIVAPATVGNNAPVIGVSCVRQAAVVSATLSCAQNATPDPDPAALTAQIDCPAGTVAPNGASSPAPGGTVNATAVAGTTATGSLLFTNTGGTAPYDLTSCTASAGFTITSPTFPTTIAPGGSQVLTVSCLAPAVGTSTAGTLDCTTTDPVFGNPTYILSCNGISAVVPAIGNAGKILLASLVIGLGLLGMGLRRQA